MDEVKKSVLYLDLEVSAGKIHFGDEFIHGV